MKPGMIIKPQTWLAWYPGKRKLNDIDRFYEYGMGIGKYVWDASDVGFSNSNAIGHLVNSCHPMLPPPYNSSNAVYICVSVGPSNKRRGGARRIRAGVYAEHEIVGGQEILTDYHWFLDGIVHKTKDGGEFLLRCQCEECLDLRRIRISSTS